MPKTFRRTASSSKQTTNADVYAKVTAKLVASLEAGVVPWEKPFSSGFAWPRNAASGREYSGLNVFALFFEMLEKGYQTAGWLTFNQAKKAGVMVRKGEKGTPVFYMNALRKKPTADQTAAGKDGDRMFIARLFFVFNLDQVDDMAGSEGAKAWLLSRAYGFRATEFDPIAEAEALVARSGAVVKLGGQAAYSPDLDIITMPPRMAFPKGAETYYPTLFHELGHWTGHDSRLARDLKRFDKDRYAVEELVAEMTAAFLSARLGLEVVSQSAAYLGFWVKALKANPSILTTAASAAQKASDYLLPRADTAETEEETAETMAA